MANGIRDLPSRPIMATGRPVGRLRQVGALPGGFFGGGAPPLGGLPGQILGGSLPSFLPPGLGNNPFLAALLGAATRGAYPGKALRSIGGGMSPSTIPWVPGAPGGGFAGGYNPQPGQYEQPEGLYESRPRDRLSWGRPPPLPWTWGGGR